MVNGVKFRVCVFVVLFTLDFFRDLYINKQQFSVSTKFLLSNYYYQNYYQKSLQGVLAL